MLELGELVERLKKTSRVAVLTGAGVSAESGIPTFRGKDGLWNKYKPEELASPKAFFEDPLEVWKWYLWRMWLISKAKPNPAHIALAKWEDIFPSFFLITQNVDGLHQRAGSKNVIELHGNIFTGKCRTCGRVYDKKEMESVFKYGSEDFLSKLSGKDFQRLIQKLKESDLPRCKACLDIIGPGVVWFGEEVPSGALNRAIYAAKESEVFFSIGTSAIVQPAASLPLTAKKTGAVLVEINLEETPISQYCDYVFKEKASKILSEITMRLL